MQIQQVDGMIKVYDNTVPIISISPVNKTIWLYAPSEDGNYVFNLKRKESHEGE